MPHTCIAYGCFNRGGNIEGITFHRFPKDEDLRRRWIIATNRKDWEPNYYSKLCSTHFREEDIDRTSLSCVRIREGAVPAIFPAFPEESQVKNRRKFKRKTEEASTSNKKDPLYLGDSKLVYEQHSHSERLTVSSASTSGSRTTTTLAGQGHDSDIGATQSQVIGILMN